MTQISNNDHFTIIGNMLANAVLRQRRGDPPASKMDLIHDSPQSETCAREAGLKVREPGEGAGRTGLAEE
jgi:hypothetical protein